MAKLLTWCYDVIADSKRGRYKNVGALDAKLDGLKGAGQNAAGLNTASAATDKLGIAEKQSN